VKDISVGLRIVVRQHQVLGIDMIAAQDVPFLLLMRKLKTGS
jgi:hypothetical protein